MRENIGLDKLSDFEATLSKDLMRNHERRFADRIKNVKRSSDDLAAVADRLEVSVRNAWGSLDKATSEQGLRLTQTIRDRAQQLSNQTVQSAYKDSDNYHETAVEASNKIILAIRRYVPKLHKTLKTDIASLNSSLAKFEDSINLLGTALDESPGSALETLEADVRILLEKNQALKLLQAQNVQILESISKEVESESVLKAEQDSLLSNDEFRQLKHYEEALRTKEEEIDQFLQPLLKPLKKFEKMRSTDNLSQPERQAIAKLIEDSKNAVFEIDNRTVLQILKTLGSSLMRGDLQIEDRKRKRAEEVIVSVDNGELERVRQSYFTLKQDAQNVTDRLAASGLIQKRDELFRQLTEIQSKELQLNVHLSDNKRRVDEMTKAISKQRALIESKITELSGKEVDVRVES